MKKLISAVTVCLTLVFASCKKTSNECGLVQAKIIRYDCDRVIFQLITSESIGDANWVDVQTGQRFTNVVSYYNTCAVNTLTNGELASLYVNVKKTTETLYDSNCNQCQAISDNPPQTKVDFISISKTPCSEIPSSR